MGREKIPQTRCRAISLASMRAAMDRLERFVTRRRRLVLGVWIVLVVAAVPFAAQQTKHLTAGGFEVPGSGSQAVSEALKRFPGVQTEPLILVFDNSKKDAAALAAAVDKADAGGPGDRRTSACRPQAAAAAKAAGDQPIVLLALDVKGGADSAVDAAVDLRKNLAHPGQRQPGAAGAPGRPAGAVGGAAGRLQGGPREGRVRRLPGRLHHPARRLRLARRRAAAVQPRRRRPWCSPARRSTSSRRRCRCRSS